MTETTSPQLMNLSPGLGCHKNALEIAAGQSEEGREEGMCLIRLGKARQLLARVRKEQGARLLQPKSKHFAWLMQENAATGGHLFTAELAVLEARSFWMRVGGQLHGAGNLGAFSREKRRTGIPATPPQVGGAEHWLDPTSWLIPN